MQSHSPQPQPPYTHNPRSEARRNDDQMSQMMAMHSSRVPPQPAQQYMMGNSPQPPPPHGGEMQHGGEIQHGGGGKGFFHHGTRGGMMTMQFNDPSLGKGNHGQQKATYGGMWMRGDSQPMPPPLPAQQPPGAREQYLAPGQPPPAGHQLATNTLSAYQPSQQLRSFDPRNMAYAEDRLQQQAPPPGPPPTASARAQGSAQMAAPAAPGTRVRVRNQNDERWMTGVLVTAGTAGQQVWVKVDGKDSVAPYNQWLPEQPGAATGQNGAPAPPPMFAKQQASKGVPAPWPVAPGSNTMGMPPAVLPHTNPMPLPSESPVAESDLQDTVCIMLKYISNQHKTLLNSHEAEEKVLKTRKDALATRRAELERREQELINWLRGEKEACDKEQEAIKRVEQEMEDARRCLESNACPLMEDFRDIDALRRRLKVAAGEDKPAADEAVSH